MTTTEDNWQAEKALSKFGQCGKFVIDDENQTIRLPAVVNAQGLLDLTGIGNLVNESLPNITGSLAFRGGAIESASAYEGVFAPVASTGRTNGNLATSGSGPTYTGRFNASLSSSTYQDNAPVQQEAIQYPFYIQVATGIEETLPAIREYGINTPFFFGQSMYSDVEPNNASWLLSNDQWNSKSVYPDYYVWLVSSLGKDHIKGMVGYAFKKPNEEVRWWTAKRNPEIGDVIFGGFGIQKMGVVNKVNSDGTIGFYEETLSLQQDNLIYTESENINVDGTGFDNIVWANDYDFIINTADETFRLPLKTKLASGSAVAGNGMALGMTDGTNVGALGNNSSLQYFGSGSGYGEAVGTTVSNTTQIAGKTVGVTTDPEKSGIETSSNGLKLYFYVGDVVQDASLINAGAVLNQLSDKISRTATSDKEMVVSWGLPDYSASVALPTDGTVSPIPSNGWVEISLGAFNKNQDNWSLNGVLRQIARSNNNTYSTYTSLIYPVNKGDTVAILSGEVGTRYLTFYPCRGVN